MIGAKLTEERGFFNIGGGLPCATGASIMFKEKKREYTRMKNKFLKQLEKIKKH